MRKNFKKLTVVTSGLLFFLGLVFTADLIYCHCHLSGALDMDTELEFRDGVAYKKGSGTPYTGSAYQTACGGECSILGCYSLHQYSQYSNGLLNGLVYLPKSDKANDFFNISIFGNYKIVPYLNGVAST